MNITDAPDQSIANLWPEMDDDLRRCTRSIRQPRLSAQPKRRRTIAQKIVWLSPGESITVFSPHRPDGFIMQAAAITGAYYASTKTAPSTWIVERKA